MNGKLFLAAVYCIYSAQASAQSEQPIHPAAPSAVNAMSDAEVLTEVRRYVPPSLTLTPAQARQIIEKMQRMRSIPATMLQVQQRVTFDSPSPASMGAHSEAELSDLLSRLPARPDPLLVEDRKDGFTVNGRAYVDPEGFIKNHVVDPVSGIATYLAEVSADRFVIKILRAGTTAEAITIATALWNESGWQIDSVTGKRMSGNSLSLLNGGYMVSRDTAVFLYVPGKGVRSMVAPDGFIPTRWQRGDVLGTGYILLERMDSGSASSGLLNALKGLGSTLSVATIDDYQLLNIDTGAMIPMNIPKAGKDVGEYSGCRKQNALVNKCAKVDFKESLYTELGRNLSHYFWRINWYSTPVGPILIAQQNGLRDITVQNLKTDKKIVALSRGLGIAGFDTNQSSDGKIRIRAKMGFSTETVDDAVQLLELQSPGQNIQ